MQRGVNKITERGLRSFQDLAAGRPHGDRLRYLAGCKCTECRAANSRYECLRARARKNGDWNGIVPAGKARRHLSWLHRKGIGRRSVSVATDIPESLLHQIRKGRRRNIRARTERKILAAAPAMVMSDKTLLPAARLWRHIAELMAEGYTKAYLARQLGYKTRALQFNPHMITARSDANVAALYRRLMT